MKKKLMSRCGIILMAALMIVVTSCTSSTVASKTTTKAVASTVTQNTEKKLYADKVEDMGGYEFTIATAWLRTKVPSNATLFERLFHQRMAEVEKAYNCKIKIVQFYASMESMIPKILAGEKVADVVDTIADMWTPAAGAGYLRPWDTVSDIINTNDTRWNPYNNATKLNGKNYVLSFERPGDVGTILWYNKDILKSSGIKEDPAQLVLDGKWTWDKFREMLKATTQDTNNDGKKDVFGLVGGDSFLDIGYALGASNGAALVSQTSSGLKATYTDQKFVDALNFYDKLVNVDKTVRVYDNMKSDTTWGNMPTTDTVFNEFRSGKIAFMSGRLWYGNSQLKPFIDNFKYGMVVYPKGPSATDYASNGQVLGGFTLTSTNKDYVKSAKIFNALARPPAGYEEDGALYDEVKRDFFQTDDTLSYKMYELSMSKVKIDLGFGVKPLITMMNNTIAQTIFWRFNTPATAVQAMAGTFDTNITDTYKKLPK